MNWLDARRGWVLPALFGVVALATGCVGGTPPPVGEPGAAEAENRDFALSGKDGQAVFSFLMGQILYRENRFVEAEEAFTEVARADPDAVEVNEMVAQLAIQRGDLVKAMAFSRAVLDKDPDRVGVRLLLASLLKVVRQYAAAAEHYERLIRENKSPDQIRLLLAPLYGLMKRPESARKTLDPLFDKPGFDWRAHLAMGQAWLNVDNQNEALKVFRQAVQMEPFQLEPVLALGGLYQRMGRAQDAEETYRSYLDSNPRSQVVHDRLGRLMLTQDKRKEALEEFRAVTNLAPQSIQARLTTALILLSQGSYEDALQELRLSQALQPDNPGILYYLGQTLDSLKRGAEAVQEYGRIKPEDPFYLEAQIRLAYYEANDQRPAEAMARIDQLLARFPDKPEVYVAGTILALQREAFEQVVTLATRGLAAEPGNGRLLFNRAMAYDKLKQWPKAEQDLLDYLQANPDDPQALNYLAYTWADRNEHLDRSYAMLKKAAELAPEDGFITDSLGWVLFRLNRLEESRDIMRKAVSLEPQDPTINEHLGDVLKALGQMDEALVIWQRALDMDTGNQALRDKIRQHGSKP
ncbi:MAG: tetratricopeptide repeat protein [Magnetococcales bacterium]|nr:tetratricopeptide repeat protein [Magnetococcales bacterium]